MTQVLPTRLPATRLQSKLLCNLTPEERRACNGLHMNPGLMQGEFCYDLKNYPRDARAVMLKERDSGKLLAWALLFPIFNGVRRRQRAKGVYLYVRRSHRRLGLGRRVMNAARRQEKQLEVYPWDPVSRSFFHRYNRTPGVRVSQGYLV